VSTSPAKTSGGNFDRVSFDAASASAEYQVGC
jgi:hypothetical protein